jgi:predicted SnoaL-like aldol condensation-catalyzing enzyme
MGRCGWKSSFNLSGAKAVEYSRSQYITHLLSVLPGKRSIVIYFQEEKEI